LARANGASSFDGSVTHPPLKSEPRIFSLGKHIGGLKIGGQPDESMTHINFVVKKLFEKIEKMRINSPACAKREFERVGQIP
jgi:hypothetical protein